MRSQVHEGTASPASRAVYEKNVTLSKDNVTHFLYAFFVEVYYYGFALEVKPCVFDTG